MKTQPLLSSFRIQLTLMMICIITVMLVTTGLYFKLIISPRLERTIIQSASLQARVIGTEALSALSDVNDEAANRIAAQFSSYRSVSVASLLLPNQALLGYYSRIKGIPLPSMDVSSRSIKDDLKLTIAEPIFENRKLVGYIYVEHNLDELFGSKNSFASFLIIIGLSALAIAFIIAGFFQKLLTIPITKMVNHLHHLHKSKDFKKRLKPTNDRELGRLVKGFNQMLDAAQEREKELATRGKQLQKLVDVRTKQLFQKAHYDSLTGLPNRYLLVDRLQQAISKSARSKSCIALLYLDLDRFKVVNDNFGHQNGDLLLKEVAKRLKKAARDGDTVARLGGDEFVFLLENLVYAKDAARTALRIIDCFGETFKVREHVLHISTSIGISVYPEDGLDQEILLKNADISMYHAKKKGLGNFSYYSEEMNNASLERLAIEANLRIAIQNDELSLVYQPQKHLNDDCYRNAEALLRWESAELGTVSPGVFIPIAEETGIIKKIDLWVISEVCKQMKIWKDSGLVNLTVAVNVSAGHLISSSLVEHLKTEIIVNKLRAEQIEIEITEEVFVEQTERTIDNLRAIKALGAKIAIDDFGTGYSSLQYIQDFPADTLKLDGMFIKNLQHDKASQGIVRSTIILAHSLGLELVAECVEEPWQFDFLKENQCDLIQGYFLCKPVKADRIPEICQQANSSPK